MKKAMYIPKGQECYLENLYCENLIVHGTLKVSGEIVAKNIRCVKGVIRADRIRAKVLVGGNIGAQSIILDVLIADQVTAGAIHAALSMTVSTFIAADYVKCAKVTVADADIADLHSNDVIYLPPKKRSLLRTLFSSFISSKWLLWFSTDIEEYEGDDTEAGEDNPSRPHEDTLEHDEFLKLKEMYMVAKENGYTLQLVPVETRTEAVQPATAFTIPTDEVA